MFVEILLFEMVFKIILFNLLNDEYIKVSHQIIELNEKRLELVEKIRIGQQKYKQLIGEGEINLLETVDEDNKEEKIIEEVQKTEGKRGRKKK